MRCGKVVSGILDHLTKYIDDDILVHVIYSQHLGLFKHEGKKKHGVRMIEGCISRRSQDQGMKIPLIVGENVNKR